MPIPNSCHGSGGYGAAQAVQALLLQKGLAEYEKVDEELDKSKLTHYLRTKEKHPAQVAQPKSKLSEWKPRHWEEDAPASTATNRNSLSIARSRQRPFLYGR
eukprot:Skav200497  [mRNA]  locus=scaffold450:294479:294784:+ [translate_table: standard]